MKKSVITGSVFVLMLLAGYTVHETEASEENQTYTYEDFKGYYGHFSPEGQNHVETLITISENYISVGWWMSELEWMEITEKTIEGDTLILEFYQEADGAYVLEDTWGTLEVTLQEEGGSKALLMEGSEPYNSLTEQEVTNYDFDLKDFIKDDMQK